MSQYVYSTLTADNEYADWVKTGDREQQMVKRSVLIKGGHGVMNKNFITPLGVVTEVTDEELEFLLTCDAFKLHMKNDFIKVDKKKQETEKVAADMKRRDQSSPIVPSDYAPGGMMDVKEPKTGSVG